MRDFIYVSYLFENIYSNATWSVCLDEHRFGWQETEKIIRKRDASMISVQFVQCCFGRILHSIFDLAEDL